MNLLARSFGWKSEDFSGPEKPKHISEAPRTYGLTQVYPDPQNTTETTEKAIDVIVLHGLAARSPKTFIAWKVDGDENSGDVNWLSDSNMLPAKMPEARILTYDWNADYDKDASSDIFAGHARSMLDRIYVNRNNTARRHRPIVFVASCFGGLLLAKALVRATVPFSPRHEEDSEILRYTVGAAFLGTPFRGSWGVGYTAAQLRIAVAMKAQMEENVVYSRELVEYLRSGTMDKPGPLDELVNTFSELIHSDAFKFPLVCFFENRKTDFSAILRNLPSDYVQTVINERGCGYVVEANSACLQGVDAQPLDCRHNMLHKFNSPNNDGFQRLTTRLDKYAKDAENTIRSKVAHQQSLLYTPSREIAPIYELTLEERECLRTLYPGNYKRYKDRNPKRVDGTCRWVLDHRLYDEWLQIHQSTLLWISADPGCGKSVLAKALVDQDLTIPDDASLLYFFFKDDNADQKSSAKAMAALLHQLFSRPQRSFLIRHAMPDYRSIGQSIVDSFSSLWEIFALAANDPRAGPIYCVLDALDECVIEDRRELLATLEGAFNEPENSELGGNVKFLVTSRPYQDIERQFYFLIRLEGEKETNIIKKEIDRVIKHKVPELSKRLRLDQHQESLLETKLLSVEHRTYLWLHLVLENLVQSNNFNRTKFDKIIEDLPRSVEAAYEKILAKGEKSEQKKLLELLQLVIAATRPLSVAELNLALPLRLDDSRSLKEFVDEELESDDQFKTTMRNWCGLFLTVVDDLVYLLHQTAREFLVVKECEKVTVSTRWKHSIKFWEAEILMTQKCVAYLLFPDFNDSSTDLELKALKDGRRGFGFFKYAANTWGHHFREIQAHEEAADLGRATLKLYDVKSRRFKTWTDFCNDKVFSSPNTASSSLPLMLATNLGHHTLIQYLLQAEHDLEATEGDEKHTPFLRAVSRGDLATSKALAQLGANIEVRDLNGQTALILSSKDRNGIEMLQWLVGRKPNLEAKDRFRKSALQYALERNSEEAIMCLLDAGADKESNDEHSRSILSKVAESNLSEAVRILLSLGADSCSEDIFGQTPLMWAAQCKNDATEIIELLILHGSDLNKRDKLGRTPLHWAASSGTNLSLSNIKTLLRHNAAINAGDDKGSTPLSIVVNSPYIMNRLEIMRLLVVEKADINARDESGRTPLCSVLRRVSLFGHQEKDAEEVIRELLNSGAELDIMDGTGRTPLFWALEGGPSCLKFAETLLDFGANEGSGVLQGHSIEHWAGNRSSPINKEGRMEPIVEEIPLVAETDLRATPFEVSA